MTDPPRIEEATTSDDPANPAEAELLDQLLREGLSIDNAAEESTSNVIARTRRLLEVIFNNCVLQPLTSNDPTNELNRERAELTLSVLRRTTITRPEVLLSTTTASDEPRPLYVWLITRIIIAASAHEEKNGADDLVEALCDAAVYILVILNRELPEGDPRFMRGPQRVANVLRELRKFARDNLEVKSSSLLGYSDMPNDKDYLPQLLALHIALQTPTPFASDTELSCAVTLADMGPRISQLSAARQARYARVVAAAVRAVPVRHVLSRACTTVAGWPETDDPRWQESVKRVLISVEKSGDDSLRRDVWGALQTQQESLNLSTLNVSHQKILFLLSTAAPHISTLTVPAVISANILQRWSEQAAISSLNDVRERLKLFMKLPPSTSAKRKRGDTGNEDKVLDILRTKLRQVKHEGDILETVSMAIVELGDTAFDLLSANPTFLCSIAQCGDAHQPLPEAVEWFTGSGRELVSDELISMRVLLAVYQHAGADAAGSSHWAKPLWKAWRAIKSPKRPVRLAAGRFISAVYHVWGNSTNAATEARAQRDIVAKIPSLVRLAGYPVQETMILLLGDLGRSASDRGLCDILEILIKQLGSKNSALRSLAYTQLVDIAAHRNKQPYNLLSPYLERIGVLLAECIVPHPEVVAETMHFIGYTRQAFFTVQNTRKAVIPTLVVRQNRVALEALANILGRRVGQILVEDASSILAKIFLTQRSTDAALNFVVSLLNELINSRTPVTATRYIRVPVAALIVAIVTQLGDTDPNMQEAATNALDGVQRIDSGGTSGDLGSFLKPHMLGVLAALAEQLMTPRVATDAKRKVIRSIGALITLVGDSMAEFSPQIIASLQSTLEAPELRLQTLLTWHVFVELLKFADVGPYIGATIAAIVTSWPTFSDEEKGAAKEIVAVISGNASHLQMFRDDIVRFDHIEELTPLSEPLLKYRSSWKPAVYMGKLIERIDNKNNAISTESMRELRDHLVNNKSADIMQLASGDTFDPLVGRLIRSLLSGATRDGEVDELRELAYECIGIIGALDPDRFVTANEETSMLIMSNFTDHDESREFAIHLLRDLLVGAFRSTNDTKHQKNLAYSIQELLKFCGFDTRLVNRRSAVPLRIRQRWDALPKHVLETFNPLLDAQFRSNNVKTTTFEYPIYPQMKTYREWVQAWTVDLIGRIMDVKAPGALGDAQRIFGIFKSEPKNQDVAVAHHLLPHLVLHVLLSGDATAREQVRLEIHDVLRDQVSPTKTSGADKRMLSAQVIFDLMDHLSKWLRLARIDKDRSSHTRPVDQLLASIDTELAANAALKSRAFARSLRNFEERVFYLKDHEKRNDTELQTYYESLHEIYASLDDPDGMEGVSASVVSPTLELQIREHESTGRWTSAQSCWEVRLQQQPEDVKLHVGLLRCLKNLGHYDTLRTHIRGVLSRHPEWADDLAPFQAEAAWTIGDWETVRSVKNPPPIANVFLAMQAGKGVREAFTVARKQIGLGITTREYTRVYETALQLHMLRDVEMIYNSDVSIMEPNRDVGSGNRKAIKRREANALVANLSARFNTALPSFRVSEEILSKRRAAFSLVRVDRLRGELGQAWIQSAKIARKAGYEQTAYSAALQSTLSDAPFAFIQQAKLVHANGSILKALRELEHPVNQLIRESEQPGVIDMTNDGSSSVRKTEEDFRKERSLAKAVLLEARWSHEADRFDENDVIRKFKKATELGPTLESPFFHLGRYYDMLAANATNTDSIADYNHFTCLYYHEALQRGVKYIYQTMPRLLTVWLDLSEKPELKRSQNVQHNVQLITKLIDRNRGKIANYQFLTAFPQMISRITHSNKEVREVLIKLVYRVIREFPAQALWPTIGAMQSTRQDRREVTDFVLKKAINIKEQDVALRIADARKLSDVLLKLAEDKPEDKRREASIAAKYQYVSAAFPSTMIMPLQDALTAVLPSPGSALKGHLAFPSTPVAINGISDKVEIMPSLQQPKKLVFKGTDGKRYPFLCKPHDDLRKDARLMDFNSMINKFLNSASESRRRHLYIRTYAVMPLNEECGLLEWVANTNALKGILEKGYERHKKRVYTSEVYQLMEGTRKSDITLLPHAFKTKVIPMYRPTVFYEWFLNNWPEPSAWLTARTNYARTLAVMSMIGYVLGLGDRHGENILFDGLSGDTVHVDLNCLFDRAKTFDVPERVPFRLTQNMVDALGVTGVEGTFRKAAEITMDILRSNGDSLMSVLEAFVHDPLVEWTKSHRTKSEKEVRQSANRNLQPIQKKLRGVMRDTEMTVPNHVEALIKEATSNHNLALMYIGWAPWL